MAKEPRPEKSIHELRQEVARSRERLARDLSGLRYELDFPLKIRNSFQRQTIVWITAAVALGIVCAVMPARTKKTPVKAKAKSRNESEGIVGAGLALGALKLAATLLKPAVTSFISKKMRDYMTSSGTGRRA